jgi:non-ribosomal peptide synthetase component F
MEATMACDARRNPATAALRDHGERTALVVDDRRLSFGELDTGADRVAHGLVALGVGPATGSRCSARTAPNGSRPTTASPRPARC